MFHCNILGSTASQPKFYLLKKINLIYKEMYSPMYALRTLDYINLVILKR